jgi:hypothetical protein
MPADMSTRCAWRRRSRSWRVELQGTWGRSSQSSRCLLFPTCVSRLFSLGFGHYRTRQNALIAYRSPRQRRSPCAPSARRPASPYIASCGARATSWGVSDPLVHNARLLTSRSRQLFGEDEDAVGELDEAEKQGENGISSLNLIPYCFLCSSKPKK